MADSYKNIVITPNIGSASDDPKIVLSGANSSVNTDITLRVYPTSNGTLSFEGSAGQLFSVTNDLSGTIFSVNDVSGIPSIEVNASGQVDIARYGGNVLVGSNTGTITNYGNVIVGSTTVINSTGYWVGPSSGIQGYQGYQGTAGSNGSTGPTGPQGPQGYQGTAGSPGGTGPQGPQGYQGYQGNAGSGGGLGPQGPQGYQGTAGGGGTMTDDTSTNATYYPVWSTVASGAYTLKASSTKLYFNPSTGTLSATVFTSLSDASMKRDIVPIINDSKFDQIRPVHFKWKDNDNESYGVIAQELEQLYPEMVDTDSKGMKTVAYSQLIPLLISEVQDLKRKLG